jgi:Helix-turn-helix domain
MNMSNQRSSKPFKKLECERRGYLRMPGNALKIWLYYYSREGEERLAWASEEEICKATDLNRDTMRKWRRWLVDNGWLKLMGHRDSKTGEFAIAIYRVKEGTVAETFSDGRSRNIPSRCSRNFRSPSQPNISVSAAAESFGEEVEPLLQVDSEKQVAPIEVEPMSVKSFSQSGSHEPQAVHQDSQTEEKDKPSKLVADKAEEEAVKALRQKIGCWQAIPAHLGLPYFSADHDPWLTRIATVLYYRNRSEEWLMNLVWWAKGSDPKDREGKFWNTKLQTGDTAVRKLAEYLEKGTIAEQFDAYLVRLKGCDVFDALRENRYLCRTYPHLKAKTAGAGFDVEEA